MRLLISLAVLCSALTLASACGGAGEGAGGGSAAANSAAANSAANQNSRAETTLAHGPSGGTVPPISTGHGAGGAAQQPASGATEKPPLDTAEMDAKIQKAEAKAKAPGASAADKKSAAEAYLARANAYRDAGNPQLYKFALGDYRHVLRYDPSNREAQSKMDEIVAIYQSMGRPVPNNGLEP